MREIKFRAKYEDKNLSVVTSNCMADYKGKGWYLENGYIMRRVFGHPNANKRGYIQEHRIVVEEKLGRFLVPRKELVHHLNGKRSDNRIENLKLTTASEHAKQHVGKRNQNGSFIASDPKFLEEKYRLLNTDTGLTQVYTLSQLIGTTFRRGCFKHRGKWTGLKDKNGVEIYKGDIVSITQPQNRTALIEWSDFHGRYYARTPEHLARLLNLKTGNKTDDLTTLNTKFYYEVIGNIYENPELLK